MNYYNEHDPKAAAWLRELIKQNQIPAGHVDERSIVEIQPHELAQYTQCHFFAGIGGWSYALQLAGIPSTQSIWTGSCPCQPFSTAGNQKGQQDERHLWPAFFNLIRECRPQYVFGEQVANAIRHGWLDGISADLEAEEYTCGAAVLGAHSVGAPHIRQRLYWVANNNKHERPAGQYTPGASDVAGCGEADGVAVTRHLCRGDGAVTGRPELNETSRCCEESCGLDNSELPGLEGLSQPRGFGQSDGRGERITESAKTDGQVYHTLAHSDDGGFSQFTELNSEQNEHPAVRYPQGRHIDGCSNIGGMAQPSSRRLQHGDGGQTDGHGQADQFGVGSAWGAAAHVECRDGKVRRIPTEPAFFPLAHGVQGRVGLLRGYGNAIVPQTAAAFIQASFEALNDPLLGVW